MKKLIIYGIALAAAVFALWLSTRGGLPPDPEAAPPSDTVECVIIESRSMDMRARVTARKDIERLCGVLSRLSEDNGMYVDLSKDFPESMRDWRLEWLSTSGESLALVEINRAGTVFRGEQCFNFLGGEIFDMDYLRGLALLGEETE